MIQLSDTKAAPGLGALLGAKPKAGGDASAFALAFGSLAADGQPGFSITPPRQALAVSGSDLPEGERETDDDTGAEIGVTTLAVPFVSDTSDMIATTQPITPESPTGASPTDPASDDRTLVTSALTQPDNTAPVPTHSEATRPANLPKAKPNETPGGAAGPVARPTVSDPLPLPDTVVPIAQPKASDAMPAAAVPGAAPTIIERVPQSEAALPSKASVAIADAIPVRGAEMPIARTVPAGLSQDAPRAETPMPKVPAPESASSTKAAPPVTTQRQATAARLKPAAALTPSARGDAPIAKPVAEPTAAALTAAPVAKLDPVLQAPAKFVSAERLSDAPVGRAPRRIAVAPMVPVATASAAMPMTGADLIPAPHRARIGTPPIVTVVDPASIGLSAPVEAANRIAEPAPIDTQATDWIEGMIEQIDVMRDARADGAAATTTRIRLSPDALGAIEIILSGDGEAIDVRINADTAAARTLLAEAAPRLADMAESRGLKLAQGDAGQPGQHQAQRQQTQDQPTANRRNPHGSATTGGNPDERIA